MTVLSAPETVAPPPPVALEFPPPAAIQALPAPPPPPPQTIPVEPLVPAPLRQFQETWVPLDRWCDTNGFGAPRRLLSGTAPIYRMEAGMGAFTIGTGMQAAHWNGLELFLGFAPRVIQGHPCVHILDLEKNFAPLISRATNSMPANRVVVIDPGHGGMDTGAQSIYGGYFEKDLTLDLARRLGALLAAEGWTVFLTRTNDVAMAVSNRVAFAEQHRAAFFLSLHFNSLAKDQKEAGLETYCLTPAGMPSNFNRDYRDDPELVYPNNSFDAQNIEYAVSLHRALLSVNGNKDRGVRRARFLGVLQRQHRPAVLVEGGYISNPAEARKIAEPAYRQRMAEAMAGALNQNAWTLLEPPGRSAGQLIAERERTRN